MTARSRIVVAVVLAVALVGAAREGLRRLEEIRWWRGGADQRAALLYGPYREALTLVQEQVPAGASLLLVSDVDPALLPYYLHPRRICQPDVDPETNRVFMELPPPPYPRRPLESFTVDWVLRLRDEGGFVVPELNEAGRRP